MDESLLVLESIALRRSRSRVGGHGRLLGTASSIVSRGHRGTAWGRPIFAPFPMLRSHPSQTQSCKNLPAMMQPLMTLACLNPLSAYRSRIMCYAGKFFFCGMLCWKIQIMICFQWLDRWYTAPLLPSVGKASELKWENTNYYADQWQSTNNPSCRRNVSFRNWCADGSRIHIWKCFGQLKFRLANAPCISVRDANTCQFQTCIPQTFAELRQWCLITNL
jgi:hypothetical protein